MSDIQGKEWYALHTRSHFETRVAQAAAREDIENYLPVFLEWHTWSDRRKQVSIPVFPGYLFARFAAHSPAYRTLLRIPGLIALVARAGKLASIPAEEIDGVRRMLDSRLECHCHPLIREGTRVRIRHGALRNLEGTLVRFGSHSRLVVSVPLLGRSVSVEVDTADVNPVITRVA